MSLHFQEHLVEAVEDLSQGGKFTEFYEFLNTAIDDSYSELRLKQMHETIIYCAGVEGKTDKDYSNLSKLEILYEYSLLS